MHYVDTDPSCTVKFDDIVVATQYIGPMVSSTGGGGGDTPPATSNSGGSSDSGGGSGGGCGFIKGKRQLTKGGGLSMITVLLLLIIFRLKKANQSLRVLTTKAVRGGFAKTTLFFIATALMFLLFAGTSQAADYYVSPTGTATWANCSGSTPLNGTSACSWQTAMANAVAGDVVYFRGGTYDLGTFTNNTGNMKDTKMYPANSGTASNPITFIAYPGEVPNITGTVTATSQQAWFGCGGDDDRANRDYITWDGFSATMKVNLGSNAETAIFRVAGDHCTIKNSNFTGVDVGNWPYNTEFVRIETATNALIENNYFRDLTSVSYAAVNTAAVYFHMLSNTTTVRNNTIENCEGGIYGKGNSANVSIYNNFIFNSSGTSLYGIWYKRSATGGEASTTRRVYQNVIVGHDTGILFEDGGVAVSDSLIYNNTIYTSNGTDDGIHIDNNFINTEVFNNIIYRSNPYLRYYDGTVSYSNYNAFYSTSGNVWNRNYDPNANYTTLPAWTAATGLDVNSITTDPLFVNAGGTSAADYKLQANSPARTSGRGGSYATVMGAYITGNETIGYDPDAPRVEITSPASNTVTTTNSSISISGTATDTVGIVSVTWSNDRGGSGTAWSGSATGTVNWTASNIPLQSGQNIITVTATDGDNKTGIDVLIVNPTNSGDGGSGGGSGGGGTQNALNGSGNASIGGGGCGFVKDNNGNGPRAKGGAATLAIMLILILTGISLARRESQLKRSFSSRNTI